MPTLGEFIMRARAYGYTKHAIRIPELRARILYLRRGVGDFLKLVDLRRSVKAIGSPGPRSKVGVDPVPWTPHGWGGKERPRCRRAIGRTRRSSGSGSSSWFAKGERLRSWRASSSG